MVVIYVDESIQHELGYICVGFVYCESPPDASIRSAIINAGLTPGEDEYKSGARMVDAESRRILRESISHIVLQECKLGVYIAPVSERPFLLTAISETAEHIVRQNQLSSPQAVFTDEGMRGVVQRQEASPISLVSGCDSKAVLGIQLADYVAYHCSYLLKCALEGKSKMVVVDIPNHPKAEEEAELDWLMRTELRRNFFVEHRNIEEISGDDWFFKLAGYGAYFSLALDSRLKEVAMKTFDSMYFGCVW